MKRFVFIGALLVTLLIGIAASASSDLPPQITLETSTGAKIDLNDANPGSEFGGHGNLITVDVNSTNGYYVSHAAVNLQYAYWAWEIPNEGARIMLGCTSASLARGGDANIQNNHWYSGKSVVSSGETVGIVGVDTSDNLVIGGPNAKDVIVKSHGNVIGTFEANGFHVTDIFTGSGSESLLSTISEVRSLREEVKASKEEVRQLRAEIETLKGKQ